MLFSSPFKGLTPCSSRQNVRNLTETRPESGVRRYSYRLSANLGCADGTVSRVRHTQRIPRLDWGIGYGNSRVTPGGRGWTDRRWSLATRLGLVEAATI
jgi:hypothetical protein